MSRFNPDMEQRARDTIALYPHPRSALIPVLHLAQEQNGWLTPESIEHVAELIDLSAAEVMGTATFYDMFFTHEVGRYLVGVCTNIACLLNGGYELLDHAERTLGVRSGGTTGDRMFTLEEVECVAKCDQAPCAAVNWRYFDRVTPEAFDSLLDDLRAGRLADDIPPHGTVNRVRRANGLAVAPASETIPAGPAEGSPPSYPESPRQ